MQMVILDIDDTLIQTSIVETRCYQQAVRETLGDVELRADWGDYPDVTDAGILRTICLDNRLDPSVDRGTAKRFAELIKIALAESPDACPEVAGANSMVEQLLVRTDLKVGIATGGWLQSARYKLAHIGLDPDALTIASSDHATSRHQIMLACQAMLGTSYQPPIYVGDGPWDAKASGLLNWPFIAVGARLKDQSKLWCQNFEGTAFMEILDQICGMQLETCAQH